MLYRFCSIRETSYCTAVCVINYELNHTKLGSHSSTRSSFHGPILVSACKCKQSLPLVSSRLNISPAFLTECSEYFIDLFTWIDIPFSYILPCFIKSSFMFHLHLTVTFSMRLTSTNKFHFSSMTLLLIVFDHHTSDHHQGSLSVRHLWPEGQYPKCAM